MSTRTDRCGHSSKGRKKESSDPSAPQEVLDNDDLLAPKTPPAGAYGNGAATPTSPHALDAATLQATFLLIPCQNGILF